jgi:hypothetical protein
MKASQSAIREVLAERTMALVGISRSGKKIGNAIYRELTGKGYKILPIHPQAENIEGALCYRSIDSLPEKAGAVVICVPPTQTGQVVQQAYEAGITKVWLQQGAESYDAIRFCESHQMTTVHGQCILMFAEPVHGFHGFHRWVWKMIGKYPSVSPHHS